MTHIPVDVSYQALTLKRATSPMGSKPVYRTRITGHSRAHNNRKKDSLRPDRLCMQFSACNRNADTVSGVGSTTSRARPFSQSFRLLRIFANRVD